MYYEINVSLNGKHFFATSERSITDHVKLKEVYVNFLDKFPESLGYSIRVTEWQTVGQSFNPLENI